MEHKHKQTLPLFHYAKEANIQRFYTDGICCEENGKITYERTGVLLMYLYMVCDL